MKLEAGLFSIQIEVPESEYGQCEWFMANPIEEWLKQHKLTPIYAGNNSWGTGYDANGVSNKHFVYMVRNAQETDGIAFRIQFPKCKVHIGEQYCE